ncbi:DUF7483 domain-containing protein [Desulfotomaculum sp. 1211_IL3151]|uniref:DUF7483 domain-containing protein n=1 Tax=Desulfotomaculum sp. 1211_IL3151 TaxID=3084055 RepID=UPI002FDB7E8E
MITPNELHPALREQLLDKKTKIKTGTYTGNGSSSARTISVGFTPSLVFITTLGKSSSQVQFSSLVYDGTGAAFYDIAYNAATISDEIQSSTNGASQIVTDGFTVCCPTSSLGINMSGVSYGYVAIGQGV